MNQVLLDKCEALLTEFPELSSSLEGGSLENAIAPLQQVFNSLMDQGRFYDVLTLNTTILRSFPPSVNAGELRLWCLLGIGNAQSHLDHDTDAKTAYETMYADAMETSDDYLATVALARLGDLARKQGQSAEAEQYYQDCVRTKIEIGDYFGTIEILIRLSELREEAGDWDRVGKSLEVAANILRILRRSINRERGDEHLHTYLHWEMAIWFQQASMKRGLGDFSGARRIYRKALKSAQSTGDTRTEVRILQNTASSYVSQGLPRRAIPLYRSSLQIAQANGFEVTVNAVQLGLGIALFRLGMYHECIPHYEAAREAARTGGQNSWGSLSADTGVAYIETGEVEKGLRILEEALGHFQQVGDVAWQERVLRNMMIGDARRNAPDMLQKRLHESLSLIPQPAYEARQALYQFAGNLYLNKVSDAKSAARCFRQAVEEVYAAGSVPNAGVIAAVSGSSLSHAGADGEALTLFDRASDIFSSIGDEDNLWRTRNDKGIAFCHLRDYEDAVQEFEWCLAAAKDWFDRTREAQTLLNYGEVKRLIGDIEEAVTFERQALSLYQQMEDMSGELDALNALGLCLLEERDDSKRDLVDEATSCFEDALRLSKVLKDRSREAMATRGIARAAERRRDIGAALRYFHKAATLWEREKDYGHCAEAIAACVALQVADANQWRRDVKHLVEIAIKGEVLGKAAHGVVGAAGPLFQAGKIEDAAQVVILALELHRYQNISASREQTQASLKEAVEDDVYRTLFYIVNLMEEHLTSDESIAFVDRITRPENFHPPADAGVLRQNIASIQSEIREQAAL